MVGGAVQRMFPHRDLDTFWDDSEYGLSTYVEAVPSEELVASVERELGHRLPASHAAL